MENIELKPDYKLKTTEERAALVNQIIAATSEDKLTPRYLEYLGDYIMDAITKEEKKEHLYLTENRLITINKRETSFEGLIEKFENGADGIYNIMAEDKNILLTPKVSITEEDIAEVPGLRELRDAIAEVEAREKKAIGKTKFLLRKQLIEMRKDQYLLKSSYKAPMAGPSTPKAPAQIDLSGERYLDANGEPCTTEPISLFNPDHVSALLCHYSALKIQTHGHTQDDFYYLLKDFDALVDRALARQPMLLDIVKMKLNNITNQDIALAIEKKYQVKYCAEYMSTLWRTKIPKIIAEREKEDYLIWYYSNNKPDEMKRCSKCGQVKPAHSYFFTRNKTAKDGWYSQCKTCRNKK